MEHTISLLTRTPAVLNALLADLPEAWTTANEGGNTWSPLRVVEHLIQAEHTNWMPRAKFLLQFGETRAFEPFNRTGHVEAVGKSLPELLDRFAVARGESLNELRGLNLQQADLNRRGRHPKLGIVTLSELLATWVAHDFDHLHQIARVMAHQYRAAVGPWSAYLGVLRCDGHSAPA